MTKPVVNEFVDDAYDRALEAVRNNLPQAAVEGLEDPEVEEAIKAQLRAGSVKGALEVASPVLTGPIVSQFVDDAYDRAFEAMRDDLSIQARQRLEAREGDIKGLLTPNPPKEWV